MMDRHDSGQAGWSLTLIIAILLVLTLSAGIERQDYKSYQLSEIKVFQPVKSIKETLYEYPIIVCYSVELGPISKVDINESCHSSDQQIETEISMPWWYGEPLSLLY